MSEWWLIFLFAIIASLTSVALVYPLRRRFTLCLGIVPILFVLVFLGYYMWGNFGSWQKFIHQKRSEDLAAQVLKSIKSPQELIVKLKEKLAAHPDSARGWYLLGRIYSSQNEIQNALAVFEKAYHLEPKNEQYAVHYAHALWQMNQQQFSADSLEVFKTLLKNNPNQPDALAMLAMNAYLNQNYDEAIAYWDRLLKLMPEQSEESLAIRKAIAKAQVNLKKAPKSEKN